MNFYIGRQKIAALPRQNLIAGATTLMVALLTITPLCGFLFQCGCDWPWLGLDAHCNYYQPQAEHQCPWCASMLVGVFATGSAIVSGVAVAIFLPTLWQRQVYSEICMRILQGLMVFAVLALVAAGIAAKWQHYPLGVGSAEERYVAFLSRVK